MVMMFDGVCYPSKVFEKKKRVLFQKTIILPLYFIVDNLILNLMYTDKRESGLQHNKESRLAHTLPLLHKERKKR